jgi:hypothetical protein
MKKKKKSNARREEKDARCPICMLFDGFKDKMDECSDIVEHFSKAKREVLEGLKKIIEHEMGLQKKRRRKRIFLKLI